MLLLLFDIDRERYALDTRHIVEVLPLVRLTQTPAGPAGVAGLLNFRGSPVPVVDLCSLMLGRPSRSRLSTRLVVIRYPDGSPNPPLLALIAEHITETVHRDEREFVSSGVATDEAPYLGRVATDPRGMVHLVDVTRLLPPALQEALFRTAVAR